MNHLTVIISDTGEFWDPPKLTEEQASLSKSIWEELHRNIQPFKIRRNAELHDRFVAEQLSILPSNSPPDLVERVRYQSSKTFLATDQVLLGPAVIYFDDGTEARVSTILSTDIIARNQNLPPVYHGKPCRDPLEPEYGRSKAKPFTDGAPLIHSFAHGEHKFPLRLTSEDVVSSFQKAVNEISNFSILSHILNDLVIVSKMDEIDLPDVKKSIKQAIQGKENKTAIMEVFKKAQGKIYSETADIKFADLDKVSPQPLDIAEYIATTYEEDLTYLGGGTWARFNNGWTVFREDGYVKELIVPILNNLAEIHPKSATKIISGSFLRDTYDFLKIRLLTRPPVPVFDSDKNLIGTSTALIDLKTMELRPKQRSDFTTKSTRIDPIPGSCPYFHAFLDGLAGNDIDFKMDLEDILSHMAFQGIGKHFIILTGPTNTGKSLFIKLIKDLLGDYAGSVSPKVFIEDRYSEDEKLASALIGKKVVFCDEIPQKGVFHSDMIKKISSGDTMRARLLYENAVDINPFCTLIIAGNHHPKLSNTDSALTTRAIDIRLMNTFVQPNGRYPNPELLEFPAIPNLAEYLRKELPQILYYLLNLARSFRNEPFHVPERFLTSIYDIDTYDIKQEWAKRRLIIDTNFPNPCENWETYKTLKEDLQVFMAQNGDRRTIGDKELTAFLTELKILAARPGDLLLRDTGKTTCVNASALVKVGNGMFNVRKHVRIINVNAPDQPQISRSEGAG